MAASFGQHQEPASGAVGVCLMLPVDEPDLRHRQPISAIPTEKWKIARNRNPDKPQLAGTPRQSVWPDLRSQGSGY